MEKTIEFLQTHGEEILFIITGLYELAVRIWPTSKNLSIIDKVIKIISFIIPNRSTKTTFINVDGSDIKETSKHIIKMIVFFVLFSISTYAQTNVTGKSFRSYNADSLTVRTEVSGLQLMYGDVGALYYNKQSSKWRIFSDSTWSDLGTGGGGSGGAFWPLAGTGTLTSNVTIDGGPNQILLQNDYGSFTMDGLQTAINAAGDFNLNSVGNGIIDFDGAGDFLGREVGIQSTTGDIFISSSGSTSDYIRVGPTGVGSPGIGFAPAGVLGVSFTSTNNTFLKPIITTSTTTLPAIRIGSFAGNPSSLSNGDIWYNSSTGKFRARQAGVSVDMIGGGGITNTAAANEMAKSDGTNLVPSGVFSTTAGDLTFGSAGLAGANRNLNATGSAADVGYIITPKGAGNIFLQPTTGSVNISSTGLTGTTIFSISSSGTSGTGLDFISGTNNPILQGGGGSSFTVKAKNASGGGNGLILKGGDATAGNTNGGNVTISGGALSGSGVNGYIVLQNLPTSCAGVPTGGLANVAGVLNVCP